MGWSAIPCAEEYKSISENYTAEGGFNASVVLRCAWSNRHALVADIFTARPAWPYGSISAYPQTATIAPAEGTFNAQGQVIQDYGNAGALVTVTWSSAAEATLISESLEPTAEFQTLDHNWFYWDSGDFLLENEAPGRLIRGLNLVRTLHKRPSVPGLVLSAVGKCNSAVVTSALLGLTFAAETLLYTPPTLNRTITTNGSQGWDITLKFRYTPETWNKFWRIKTMQYESIRVVATGEIYKNHPTIDLSPLLA